MTTSVGDTVAAPLRVMVVDDHQTFADLLSLALSSEPDLECIGTAGSAAEAVAMAAELRPDVVVMDIEMPRQDGLAATRRLREVVPDLVIVVVTAHRDPQWVLRATQAGASAFVPKNGSLPEMLDVLRRARNGGMLVAASAFGSAVAPPERRSPRPRVELTQRERDVLHCLNRGMAPKAIARVLGISLHTCRGYVKSLLSKLGVSSQLEAVVTAQRLGLIERGPTGLTVRAGVRTNPRIRRSLITYLGAAALVLVVVAVGADARRPAGRPGRGAARRRAGRAAHREPRRRPAAQRGAQRRRCPAPRAGPGRREPDPRRLDQPSSTCGTAPAR